jgi:tetratricopeptide (TPR) repeat protein
MNRQRTGQTESAAQRIKAVRNVTIICLMVCLAVALGLGSVSASIFPSTQQQGDANKAADDGRRIQLLELGKPIKRELTGGQSHSFRLRLGAGQFIQVIAEQQGIDIVATLFGPDGKKLVEGNTANGPTGVENIWFIAESDCDCQLEIRPVENNAAPGRFEIELTDQRTPTNDDRAAVEMFRAMTEAQKLPKDQFEKAIPILEKLATTLESLLGPKHPGLNAALEPLAYFSYAKGDHARAEALYQRILAIQENSVGSDHPSVLKTLGNLAKLYEAKNDFAQVEALNKRQIAISEKVKGPQHPDVAVDLTYLASLYLSRGDFAEAEPLFQRALTIYEKSFGPEHPEIATVLLGLAKGYLARCDLARAEQLFKRALAIREKSLGSEHEEVKEVKQDLADLNRVKAQRAKGKPSNNRRQNTLCK